jgi:hypothetical protein
MTINTNEVIAEQLRRLAFVLDLESVRQGIDEEPEYHDYGTILKALPDQTRFKPKSMWVSLGDGTYRHLNGKKGLVTTHDRLDGYTEVIFQ